MTKRNSNKPERTARILTSAQLATAVGGMNEGGVTDYDTWQFMGNTIDRLAGVKSLTTGIGGLIG
jgi:hypothetical protein